MSNRNRGLREEIESHLRMAIRDRMERGESAAEAEANARREFGNLGLVEEVTREMWSWVWLEQLWRDVRYGLRGMCRNPGFTAVAVIALALGIGANSAIFTAVDGILLRPLSYRDPERLVVMLNHGRGPVAPANFADWKAQSRSFNNMGAAEYWTPDLTGSDRPEKLWALRVSADILPLLGIPPALGRFFTPILSSMFVSASGSGVSEVVISLIPKVEPSGMPSAPGCAAAGAGAGGACSGVASVTAGAGVAATPRFNRASAIS